VAALPGKAATAFIRPSLQDLYFAFRNFCRVPATLRVTPAMVAGVTDRVWGLEELLTNFRTPDLA